MSSLIDPKRLEGENGPTIARTIGEFGRRHAAIPATNAAAPIAANNGPNHSPVGS
ncbi:MAG TPA: hypothetical protein VK665_06470 [Candidatus Elarobacter sp.]|nr:hypothetical protein [Candidatus Elarobacter sp.]